MAKNGSGRDRQVSNATQALAVGAVGLSAGIVSSMAGGDDAGAVLSIVGGLMLLWGLHRFGRLGADPPSANSSA
jgi:hypothetical protein